MDLPRTARATRGRRLTKLLDDEVEADNTFWGQDAFREENNDREYEEEAEQVDEFDSDFDEDEPESDHEGEKEEREVVKRKWKLPYKKPGADKKKKSVSFLLKNAIVKPNPRKKGPAREEEDGEVEGGENERIIRKSSRMAVVAKQAERAAKAASQSTPKPVKRKREGERRMSQEDMLMEAAQTEVINLRSLERMLAREEEVKKKAIIQKALYTGPQIKFISKNGCNVLEFTKVNTIPSIINSKAKPYPVRAVCVITGQPAKYKDPKTGLPYATKEAFKILRERFVKGEKAGKKDSLEEIYQRKRTRVEPERDSSRAGFVKLKFKRSPIRDSNAQVDVPSSLQQVDLPPPLSPPPPLEMEDIDVGDFMLGSLDEVRRSYAIEDSILYETNEKSEACFLAGELQR